MTENWGEQQNSFLNALKKKKLESMLFTNSHKKESVLPPRSDNNHEDNDGRYLLLYCLPGVGVGAAGLLSLRLVNQVHHHYHHHRRRHHNHEGNTHDGRGNSDAVSVRHIQTSPSCIQTMSFPHFKKLPVFATLIEPHQSCASFTGFY